MNQTLERLVASRKNIVFIVDTPELYFDPKECVSLRNITLTEKKVREPCSIERIKFEERTAYYHEIIDEAKIMFPSVKFINTSKYLCDAEKCNVLLDGKLLYSSTDHLTPHGSRYLMSRMKNELFD